MMTKKEQKQVKQARARRVRRVRSVIFEHATVPRLSVFRSNIHISVQIIDDTKRKTLVASSDVKIAAKGTKTERAIAVGEDIAKEAHKLKIKRVVFDRGWYHFHGRVKALADAAEAQGLQFKRSDV